MAKKKKNNAGLISWAVTIFAAACGVAAFFMIFGESITFQSLLLGKSSYTGLQTAFGYTVNGIEIFKASAGISLAFIFPLAAAAATVIGKGCKIVAFLAAAMFITGGVLAFCIPSLLVGNYVGDPALGVCATVSGVLSIVAGVTECASVWLKK